MSRFAAASRLAVHGFVCVMFALTLGGCGPNDSPPHSGAANAAPTLSGTYSIDGTPLAGTTVVIKGKEGPARETVSDANGHYSIPVTNLTPPFFVEAGASHAAAMSAGIADVTPLTELAFEIIVNQDSHHYFVNLDTTYSDAGELGDGTSDASLFTAASLAQAQEDTLRFLASIYHLTPAAGTGDLVTSGFQPVASDPMAQTLKAYNDTVQATGIYYSVQQQTLLCAAADVQISTGGETTDFCTQFAKVAPSPPNAAVSVYEFFTQSQDHIVVEAMGQTIESVAYTPRDAAPLTCTGTACAGVVLGSAGDDGNRPLSFTATVLSGAGGSSASLTGNLVAGSIFPVLVCTGEPIYFRRQGNYTGGDCTANPSAVASFARSIYTFQPVGPVGGVEIRLDGDAVVGIMHFRYDENAQLVAVSKCRFAGCTGVTVSAPDAAGSRTIRMQGTPLALADGNGGLSGTDREQFDAVLTLLATPPYEPFACDAPIAEFTLAVTHSPLFDLCLPDESYRYASANGDGTITYVFGNYASLSLVAADTTALSSAADNFSCPATGCTGISITPVDPVTGARTVTYANTLLVETETGGFAGDRTMLINGSSAAPREDCILNGVCP